MINKYIKNEYKNIKTNSSRKFNNLTYHIIT